MKKPKEKINHSLLSSSSSSASIYYSKMSAPHIKKYDSGFSETATTVSSGHGAEETPLEQILSVEKIYFEHLKEDIIKYSRPLRRYLNPDEIVDLFQNIEKVCHPERREERSQHSLASLRFLPSRNPSSVNVKNFFSEKISLTCRFQPSINHG